MARSSRVVHNQKRSDSSDSNKRILDDDLDEEFWNDLADLLQDDKFRESFFKSLFLMSVQDETFDIAVSYVKEGDTMDDELYEKAKYLGLLNERRRVLSIIERALLTTRGMPNSEDRIEAIKEILENVLNDN